MRYKMGIWDRLFKIVKNKKRITEIIIIPIIIAFVAGAIYLYAGHYLSYQSDKELLQKVDQILVQLNETDNKNIERLIYEETGYTFDEIK